MIQRAVVGDGSLRYGYCHMLDIGIIIPKDPKAPGQIMIHLNNKAFNSIHQLNVQKSD